MKHATSNARISPPRLLTLSVLAALLRERRRRRRRRRERERDQSKKSESKRRERERERERFSSVVRFISRFNSITYDDELKETLKGRERERKRNREREKRKHEVWCLESVHGESGFAYQGKRKSVLPVAP